MGGVGEGEWGKGRGAKVRVNQDQVRGTQRRKGKLMAERGALNIEPANRGKFTMWGAGDGARGRKFGGIKFKIKVTGFRLRGRNDVKFKSGEREGAEAQVRVNQEPGRGIQRQWREEYNPRSSGLVKAPLPPRSKNASIRAGGVSGKVGGLSYAFAEEVV